MPIIAAGAARPVPAPCRSARPVLALTRTARPALVGLALLGLGVLHLSLGRGVDWPGVLSGTDPLSAQIVRELRLPRLAAATAAGAALATSGLVLQRLLRNPLASPELTAVNPAAVCALLAAMALGVADPAAPLGATAVAFCGGLLGGAIMWFAARGRPADEVAVVGVLSAMALTGVTTLVLSAKAMGLAGVLRWLIGSLDALVAEHLTVLLPGVLVGLIGVRLVAPGVDVVAVGDRHAFGLGIAADRWRAAALVVASWLAACAVAVVGPLAFVGFLAPHLYAGYTGGRPVSRSVGPVALLGAGFVVASDAAAMALSLLIQTTGSGHQVGVPTGAVTCVVGAIALARLASRAPTGARPQRGGTR